MVTLNDEQHAAVTAEDGPTLVLAGAGSGKTRVIIERLAWLIAERGVDPRRLLALTFTNKAAEEMRARLAERLNRDRVGVWLGTFHAFGLYVLRREMERLDRPKAFTVFDNSDQLSLMKRLVREMPPGLERVSPREALSWISRLKQSFDAPGDKADAKDVTERSYMALWDRYRAALRRASAVDFDDLLVLLVQLLRDFPDVREKYQERYRHVLIDEYQDTNRAQYSIARLLSEAHGNIFVVGDEDQSIYSWRGADIDNILDFAEDFPEAKIYRLERNYRSTKPILDAANALVTHNVNRLGKALWTKEEEGGEVRFCLADTGESEAQFVVGDIVDRALSPKQVAVLYRTNAQSRLVEEALRARGLHYVVIGGIKFYSRKEIKDILCYLRLIVNPHDDESLRRVVNVPARGIGAATTQRIEAYAKTRDEPLFQVLRDIETDESLPPRARKAALQFVGLIDDLSVEARNAEIKPLVETLLDRIGYRDYVRQSDEKDFRSRLEIVDEFVASCAHHDASAGGDLAAFLQGLALMSDVDEWDPSEPAVSLMTCHSAKGLEFDYVYLIGLEEGLLPFVLEFDDAGDVEEERRLCYVAMTRARKGLTLTAAGSRVLYGKRSNDRRTSRFVGEIGVERLSRVDAPSDIRRKEVPVASRLPADRLKTGTRVRHAKFGRGSVMYTKGAGETLKARVRFETGRTVMLMVKQAPLELLEGKER